MWPNKLLLLAGFICVFFALQMEQGASFYRVYVKTVPYNCTHHSSCGDITNITYPFRLKGDPPNCGDLNYELSCENNRTMLRSFNSEQYLVKADVAVQDGNCFSRPINSFSNFYAKGIERSSNLLYKFPDRLVDVGCESPGKSPTYAHSLVYVSCESPVKSPIYMDPSPCLVETKSTNNRRYHYVLAGDFSTTELNVSCVIDFITRTTFDRKGISSYMDIHKKLVYGTELSWKIISCSTCEGGDSGSCSLDNNNTIIQRCYRYMGCNCSSLFNCDLRCKLAYFLSNNLQDVLDDIRWKIEHKVLVPFLAIFFGTRALFGILCLSALMVYKWRRKHLSIDDSLEEFLKSQNNFLPIRYSHSQIKKMSKSFKNKLGEGGYGSVFKGKLRSGRLVAVKMLGKSKTNGQDFINEVATIGRIHHINVVSLVGFCSEGANCALVYEFMPKGSLDKYILSREGHMSLSWKKMYEISLGVARGIEYLHQGCDIQILHFDIKPHNILLDENFLPKISDFGLAKLYSTDKSIVSVTTARGIIGYIAPELIYKRIGGVSYKADVYSFGMLLLEMLGKRKKLDATTDDNSSRTYFPMWVYREMVEGKIAEEDAIEEEENIIKKMTVVGLWCIQIRPADRPSMRKVIQMLEGQMQNLVLPPEPTFNIEQVPAEDVEEAANPTWSSQTFVGTSESVRLVINID